VPAGAASRRRPPSIPPSSRRPGRPFLRRALAAPRLAQDDGAVGVADRSRPFRGRVRKTETRTGSGFAATSIKRSALPAACEFCSIGGASGSSGPVGAAVIGLLHRRSVGQQIIP